MIFWIFVILTVVFTIMWAKDVSCFEVLWGLVGLISGGICVIMLAGIIGSHATSNGFIASSRERYKALTYKVESENSRDNIGLLNKDYIDEIQYWNEDVAKYKALQRDFWVGIFYPNIFDEFEIIDLELIAYK